jgi:hypothetical protein
MEQKGIEMSRYLYRAWDTEEQEMFEPCTTNNNEAFFAGFYNGALKIADSEYSDDQRYIFLQCVDVRDDDNILLFEKDIVWVTHTLVENIPTFKAIIEWDKNRFVLRNLDGERLSLQHNSLHTFFGLTSYTPLDSFGLSLKRIGDEFRNPELLTKTAEKPPVIEKVIVGEVRGQHVFIEGSTNNEHEEKKELNASVCPKCGNDQDTIVYNEWFGKELWLCDTKECGAFYEVIYETTIKEIKLKEKQ